MQIHQLKPIHKQKKRIRVGRGGKRGTYSGRGIKGQSARSGRRFKPIIKELIRRYPKLRGYRQEMNVNNLIKRPAVLNLDILEKKFNSGEKVSPEVLLEKKLIRRIKGRTPGVKILSKGKITKDLIFENIVFSRSAKEKIEKAGGKIE